MFTITSLNARAVTHKMWEVSVSRRIAAKAWAQLKKRGALGLLYGVDVSNAVYRLNSGIPARCPTVDDSARASKGFKTIRLIYRSEDLKGAAQVGLAVKTMRNGEQFLDYGTYVSLLNQTLVVGAPQLKLVSNG